MGVRFTVLASGSAGNATLVQAEGQGVLIDIGLGARALGARLADANCSWSQVHAVLLTHTHTDHWNDGTLSQLHRDRIPLYCHPHHHKILAAYSRLFTAHREAGLVRDFAGDQPFALTERIRCLPLAVRHDSGPTFGFRLDMGSNLFGHGHAIGYVADLGCWDERLVAALTDVDVLAVEFNHDVQLECRSRRGPQLIMRVLGDEGHLSNEQAAELFGAVCLRSAPDKVQHLVQLHLSRECNRPALAQIAARTILEASGRSGTIHTATQDSITPTIELHPAPRRSRIRRNGIGRVGGRVPLVAQPWLPGIDPG